MVKVIQTYHKGYHFRSRLEARYSVFLDALGVLWDYEIEGFDLGATGWYLPDFWLPQFECWLEIKASLPNDNERAKAEALAKAQSPVLIACNGFSSANPKGILCAHDSDEDSAGYGEYPAFLYPAKNGQVYLVTDHQRTQYYYDADYEPRPLIISQETFKRYGGEDYQRFAAAWIAGRSARFEHGEQPIYELH